MNGKMIDYTNMFKDCTSLETIDMGDLLSNHVKIVVFYKNDNEYFVVYEGKRIYGDTKREEIIEVKKISEYPEIHLKIKNMFPEYFI